MRDAPGQLDVGRARAAMDDPMIEDFGPNLEPVHALAEVSPGFVWCLQDEGGNAVGSPDHRRGRPTCTGRFIGVPARDGVEAYEDAVFAAPVA